MPDVLIFSLLRSCHGFSNILQLFLKDNRSRWATEDFDNSSKFIFSAVAVTMHRTVLCCKSTAVVFPVEPTSPNRGSFPQKFVFFSEVNLSSCAHLWSPAPVDVNTNGAVRSAAAHEQMSSVVRLHHPDEVPTAVLENAEKQKRHIKEFSWLGHDDYKCHSVSGVIPFFSKSISWNAAAMMDAEPRTCLSLLKYPVPYEGAMQTYLTSLCRLYDLVPNNQMIKEFTGLVLWPVQKEHQWYMWYTSR